MSDNWIVQNLENALEVWNDKLSEIWQLITQSPQTFKGGSIWSVITSIHGALQAIGYRMEYNNMLLDKATGANGITQEKYVTISVSKKDIEEARAYFARVGADLTTHFTGLGSKCVALNAVQRLRILHDFYAAEDVADRVGHDVSAETKKAVNKGKEAYRKHREETRYYEKKQPKLFRASTADVGYIKNFYDVTDRDDPKYWEHFFAREIDSLCGREMDNLISTITLSQYDVPVLSEHYKQVLSKVTVAQMMRVPSSVAYIKEIYPRIEKAVKDGQAQRSFSKRGIYWQAGRTSPSRSRAL